VERVIGSMRRECLDHVIVVNAAGLHRMLTEYIAYYMRSRTHLALGKDAEPAPSRTAVGRAHCRHTRSRRSTPLRPHRRIAVARRRSQLQPGPNHPCVELSCVAVRCADVRIPEGIVCGAQRGITRGFRGGRQAFCIVFVSTFR
jgi:hypothetical protein